MATNHITAPTSRYVTSGYAFQPLFADGAVIIDADAFLVASPSALDSLVLDNSGAWNVTVNGEVFAQGGHAGIVVSTGNSLASTITIGVEGEAAGEWGLYANSAMNVKNAGVIMGTDFGVLENASATYTITNATTGIIHGLEKGIVMQGGGTHTINNAGTIGGDVFSSIEAIVTNGIEKVTNSGTLQGTVDLGPGNDSLTNSGKIFGLVFLGGDDDVFSNTGTATGNINLGFGLNKLTNSGTINGTVVGGADADTVTNSKTIVGNVSLGGGIDVFTNTGTVSGLIDLGDGDDKFTGGNNAETVIDTAGNDIIKLGGGNDTYKAVKAGGADPGIDSIDGGAGIDTYDASAAASSGGVINLDNVTHFLPAHTANGNGGNGLGISDTVVNFENATIDYGTIYGTSGANTLIATGNGGNAGLYGLGGNDTLIGGAGIDSLEGGAGKDIMTGSAGADNYVYVFASDSGTTKATRDVITDFTSGSDHIDLSAIDANTTLAGDQAFHLTTGAFPVGQNPFSHLAGELRYVASAEGAIVYGDVNGDGKADFSIDVHIQGGGHTLGTGDFAL